MKAVEWLLWAGCGYLVVFVVMPCVWLAWQTWRTARDWEAHVSDVLRIVTVPVEDRPEWGRG